MNMNYISCTRRSDGFDNNSLYLHVIKLDYHLNCHLNYSLQTFLYTKDIHWVLAIVDIAVLHNFDEKYGYPSKQRKVIQIANVIKKIGENDPMKLKAFKLNNVIVGDSDDIDDESKRDLLA